MNRLQKKCLIASTGCHLLLGLILLIGPAFLSSNPKPENVPVIEFLPMITSDSAAAGGGDPKGGLPPPTPIVQPIPPTPTPPAPVPVGDKTPKPPEPVKKPKVEEVTPPKDKVESPEAAKPSTHKIEVSTTPVIRKPDPQAAAKARADAEAKAAAVERRRIASAINRAASSMGKNFSGETSMPKLSGPGGDGVPYGNWLSAIKKIYTDAWVVPDGVTDDSATVTASITIARNGDVLSTSIVRASGNPLVDHSVKATLDRVTRAAPLPERAKEDQRTVTINFNVKAKQGLG